MRDAFASDVPLPITVSDPKSLAPLLVDLQTAARLCGCSDRHLRKFLGDLPHVRIGGRLLFRVATLESWLASREAVETIGGEA